MTNDTDQSLELISGVLLLVFLLPFALAWLEDSMTRPSRASSIVRQVPQQLSGRRRDDDS